MKEDMNHMGISVGWRYRIIKQISSALCSLSYERVLVIGRRMGPLIMNRIEKQKTRGLEQICQGLGYSPKEAEQLLQKVYENIGMSAMEMMYVPRLVREKDHITDYIDIDHPEYLESAFAEGKGVIGLTAHLGNWEWLGAGLALHGCPTSAIGKKQSDDALMKMINEYRALAGQHIYLTGTGGYELIAAARSMKQNHILGFLSDKDGGHTGVPVQFMNRTFSFPQGPAVFARRFQAPIVPLFIIRRKNGKGHTICVQKAFHYENTGGTRADLLKNSQKMADVLETFIKKHPAEWLWFQHLFWTEPDKIEMLKELKREIP
jgi:KDO2-lipid IV(A) lauroyltransferase